MGKGKHKKVLRSEKAKVKLKGVKLLKAQNVTKTDFKVKKIIVREQLREESETATEGIPKVNIKDLLGKLRHNNPTIKQDSLKSIREVIGSNPEELFPKHLGEILQTIGQMCLDIEKDVRRESFRCLQSLLGGIDVKMVDPFFEMLSSYLRCAMTHLQNAIQDDSLLLLDVLLEKVPHLVARNSDKIFTNFLDMVSKLRSESQPGRTLSLNLGKKITAVKWRIRVLERLLKLLQALNVSLIGADTEASGQKINFKPDGQFYAPILTTPKSAWCEEVSGLFIQELSSLKQRNAVNSSDFSETHTITRYVDEMVPLLIETWMEIRPEDRDEREAFLGQEAISTISLIVGILEELWNLVVRCDTKSLSSEMRTWLKVSYSRDFCQTFMVGFPYNFSQKSRTTSSQEENLRLCYLYCRLSDSKNGNNSKLAQKIIEYVIICLGKNNSPMGWGCLFNVLRIILVENAKSWSANSLQLKKLCDKLLQIQENAKLNSELRLRILLLVSQAFISTNANFLTKDSASAWFTQLRHALSHERKINQDFVEALTMMYRISRDFTAFLGQETSRILINISDVEILNSSDVDQSRRNLANFVYWLPERLPENILNLVENQDLREYVRNLDSLKK
ncbi:hypothetical protein DMENIID0001_032280 [Sergentomyia squamirostris]